MRISQDSPCPVNSHRYGSECGRAILRFDVKSKLGRPGPFVHCDLNSNLGRSGSLVICELYNNSESGREYSVMCLTSNTLCHLCICEPLIHLFVRCLCCCSVVLFSSLCRCLVKSSLFSFFIFSSSWPVRNFSAWNDSPGSDTELFLTGTEVVIIEGGGLMTHELW